MGREKARFQGSSEFLPSLTVPKATGDFMESQALTLLCFVRRRK